MRAGTRRLHGACLVPVCALTAVFALLVAACGDGDAAPEAGGAKATARAPDPDNCPLEALDRADAPVEVTVWHGLVGEAQATLEELADGYNASQDRVRVRVDAQGSYEELFAKYTAASRAPDDATLPDVVLAQDTDTRYLVDSGTVLPAADCIAADPDAASHYDTLAELVRAAYTVDGLLWPAAYGVATPVLYYNRAHLEQAGLDPDDPPGDLEELRAAAEAIKAVRPEGHPLAFRAHSWWLEHLSTGQGDALVDHDNGRAGPAGRRGREAGGREVGLDGVDGGSIDLGVGELPGMRDSGSGQVSGNAWYLVDGPDNERIAAAWDFLRSFTRTPQQVTWVMRGSYLPVWQGAVDDPELQRYLTGTRPGCWLEVARRSLEAVDPEFPGPLIGPYMELREVGRTALEAVLIEGRPVDEALDRADAAFQAALDEYARDLGAG